MGKKDTIDTKKIWFLFILIVIVNMVLGFIFQNICNLNVYDKNKLDSVITTKVYKPDGTVLEKKATAIPPALDGGSRLPKA